jgi:hypothetical protein
MVQPRPSSALALTVVLMLIVSLIASGCQGTPAPATPLASQPTASLTPAPVTPTAAPSATASSLAPTAETPAATDTPSPQPPGSMPTETASPSATPISLTATPTTMPLTATRTATLRAPTMTASSTPAIDIIVDNADTGMTWTGSWFTGDGGHSYNGDCKWAPRGIGNIAYVRPNLPVAGSYEVYAWWCGDPNHDQATRAIIEVYPGPRPYLPKQVTVNYQENAGQWNSLGTYNLTQTGSLSIDGNLAGNVVADAYHFVYRGPASTEAPPTPYPTPVIWTTHPPSPLEQLTSGDLSARLGLVQFLYPYTPIISSSHATFDDCTAFPRAGCSGTREGWDVRVQYQDMVVPYRVADDYRDIAIQAPAGLADRQLLYMFGSGPNAFVRVDHHAMDNTWHWGGGAQDGSYATSGPLPPDMAASLAAIATRVGPLKLDNGGVSWRFYGLGPNVEPNAADRARLLEIGQALAEMAWP